ncbi:hypothetical protein [Streptomyces sp. NPDC051173]|uniref:hypothetical protein n=1 Tax=Streptomyces sp. NPDC051173 TaxID=3155164 RepID=UPI00344C62EC
MTTPVPARRTTQDLARRRVLADAASGLAGPAASLPSAALEFREQHGDPVEWTSADWKTYAELGGVA